MKNPRLNYETLIDILHNLPDNYTDSVSIKEWAGKDIHIADSEEVKLFLRLEALRAEGELIRSESRAGLTLRKL